MNAEPSLLAFTLPEKIRSRHNDRQAIVYVWQSTVRQVEHNRESTRLQYALADRAFRLGWRRDQITVIDDDLGRSGALALDRPGFQRLVAEVGLGHVGMVIGIEVSRLARSCRDWHQLLEMCALFDTTIGDADGVYDPSTYNDRLLLGLKGTMSEAELHILKARMHEGRKAKARRGELILGLPRGYVLRPQAKLHWIRTRRFKGSYAWSSLCLKDVARSAVSCVTSLTMTSRFPIVSGAALKRATYAGTGLTPRRSAACFVILVMPVPMSSGVAVTTAGCASPASRIAVDAWFAIRKNGWCCTKTHSRHTLAGKPISGIRN